MFRPVLTLLQQQFEMDGFEFDLAMVILAYSTIPEDFDITDDRHLRNLDTQSVTSLNGARVTDTIQKLVPQMQVAVCACAYM
jgi:poly(A) polymerase Pap1